MSETLFNFDLEPPEPPSQSDRNTSQSRVAEWQLELIRKILDARGLTETAARRAVVEGAVGRSVESLRHLTFAEAHTVVEAISKRPNSTPQASAWDSRDEDTWLDKL